MDSLVANYASSDEEEEPQNRTLTSPPKPTSLFSSLPQPKSSSSSSLFSSVPQPKQQPSKPTIHHNNDNSIEEEEEDDDPKNPSFKSSSSSLFSSLPQPKQQPISNPLPLDPTPKRVVQFKPPIISSIKQTNSDDEEDEKEKEKERKRRKESEFLLQSSSVKSFLSSIPAPKSSSTLGALPSAAGSGRRSIIETEAAPTSSSAGFGAQNESGVDQNTENYDGNYGSHESGFDQSAGDFVNYGGYGSYESGVHQHVGGGDGSSYGSYETYGRYGNYGDYGQYGNNWGDGSVAAVPETTGAAENPMRIPGKRGRNDIPTDIVEVKQDELIKNRPREDQVKLTGIAFGPSYQPVSTKGKPSKLHKRKHQIGSLYFDMKQKETELAERRAKGFLTKAETQAKYGW